ncbi:alpha/beta-hydrolase [Pseudovirgaria hyperparasitica]|uniref:Alpha/beta-hydrolase n=1 Tax=Pseudovirgaria hyperparasitica TaxID=470096 RepID=A0A6A6WBQ2_9PEZI|nr:alpha/beta-hydrolase [Pseudovirgaria hyperparasitica]KAF2758541.1 alpha/beta-hydrolase [Pseudovirgaria hyperparasitica]
MATEKKVEFLTIDGLMLRGILFEAQQKGGGVVLSTGFNCVKEMLGQTQLARAFQDAGITALLYDPRTTGESDGQPRNHIQPYKQVEDISDAITYLASLPIVDPNFIGVWGMSLGGATTLCAASFDRRAKFVIAICPAAGYQFSEERLLKVLEKCFQDRESQINGNEPFMIPLVNTDGINPAGCSFGNEMEVGKAARFAQAHLDLALGWPNKTTIQSYHQLMMWTPWPTWKHLDQTPTMFIVPEFDRVCPVESQKRHFEQLKCPKRLILAPDSGHFDVLTNTRSAEIIEEQIRFIMDVFHEKFKE